MVFVSVKFGAPSLQRNSRPAGWAERSCSSVIPVSLCRFLSKRPWNLSRLAVGSLSDVPSSLYCADYSVWWLPPPHSDSRCLSASSSFSPLPHTLTEAAGQGSYCAELCFKGTEPRTLKHTHSETRGVHTRDVNARPRNSLTAQTGTETDYRYRSGSSCPPPVRSSVPSRFYFHHPELFLGGLVTARLWTAAYFPVTVYFWIDPQEDLYSITVSGLDLVDYK